MNRFADSPIRPIDKNFSKMLIQEQLSDQELQQLLEPVGFTDWQTASLCLRRIATTPQTETALIDILPYLLLSLTEAANPGQALVNFERFVHNAAAPFELLHDLANTPRAIEILVKLFAGSQYLTEILLRHPQYFERLMAHHSLIQPKSKKQLADDANNSINLLLLDDKQPFDPLPSLNALRRFQHRELLRIGIGDLLGSFDMPTITTQLSYLTASIIQAGITIAAKQTGVSPVDFVVIAMGKLGGEELNYSSDIDLLFLAKSTGSAYLQFGQRLIDILARSTEEGFLYRVDMRLRPWGRDGALVCSLNSYLTYLDKHAKLWEKQALLKARPVAGNKRLGQEFISSIQPTLFKAEGETVRAELYNLKQRIEAQLRKRGQEWGEVKLGQGSIRDIEFVVQYLQLAYGGNQPNIRSYNTLDALNRLAKAQFLSPDHSRMLSDGYVFLRTVEHHLQLMHYRQTHALPTDKQALTYLAKRLGFQGITAGDNFIARFEQHSAVIRLIYQYYLASETVETETDTSSSELLPHLTRMHPTYVTVFSEPDIEHHVMLMKQLNEKIPVKVEAIPLDDKYWQVTFVGYDYLGELSLICGLMFVYGFNIINGHVFSYGPSLDKPSAPAKQRKRRRRQKKSANNNKDLRRKIVDVFTVKPVFGRATKDDWQDYSADLLELVRLLQAGNRAEAQGKLVKKVATVLQDLSGSETTLYPIDVDIDNETEQRHTIMQIDAPDSIGFLYELTNSLALTGINIRRMELSSIGNHVRDTVYITNQDRQKITAPDKQRELRVATTLIKQFTHMLPHSPNPEAALLHFREYIGQLFSRPNWPDELTSLKQPELLKTLARLLGGSDFLWDDFLRMQHANLFPIVRDVDALSIGKTKDELRAELATSLHNVAQEKACDILNDFKDREMFRIDMRQIQKHITELEQFSSELTDLAEVVIEGAYNLATKKLRDKFGLPRLENGRICPLVICAFGKGGGRELGFASDIELMFIFDGKGKTTGQHSITAVEFYSKLVQEITYIIRTRREGIFTIDLRLRPYGKAGSMAVSLESFQRYFAPTGDAWSYERQALVKLTPIIGDQKLGQHIVSLRDEFIYNNTPFDIAAMRAMRERQIRHLVTAGTINTKYSPGGLVDIEYLIQGLQITHGHSNPKLRLTNTEKAITALAESGIIPTADYLPLHNAHIFMRRLINALRMVRGNAKDLTVPPKNSDEFSFLARRLNYKDNLTGLYEDLIKHTTCVLEINRRLLRQS